MEPIGILLNFSNREMFQSAIENKITYSPLLNILLQSLVQDPLQYRLWLVL